MAAPKNTAAPKIALRKLDELTPDPRNARTHSPEQIDQIRASIERFGWTNPVLADDMIRAGHGRCAAARAIYADGGVIHMAPGAEHGGKALPAGTVPVIDCTGWTEDERKAYALADNQIALASGWDYTILSEQIAELAAVDFDMGALGLDAISFEPVSFSSFDPVNISTGDQANGNTASPGGETQTDEARTEKRPGSLAAEFMIPPFTVLSAREGWWMDRKRAWLGLGIKSEVGRGENLLRMSDTMLEPDPEKRAAMQAARDAFAKTGGLTMEAVSSHPRYYEQKAKAEAEAGRKLTNEEFERDFWVMPDSEIASGTSIFDPVLCEIAYRWFSPLGGRILDPFSGGSVRGIVAAAIGRAYTGIDLRAEQIEANREQWPTVAANLATPSFSGPEVPDLMIEEIEGINVVRDDRVLGGTKRRALDLILPTLDAEEIVYATPAYGFAQIALAGACRAAGKKATVFVAERAERHIRTTVAASLGANIVEVKAGRLNVIQSRARKHCEETGAFLVPFGMEDQIFIDAIAQVASGLPGPAPSEVWCVAGSGVLSRALQKAFPDAKHHAVQIGRTPDVGNATLWKAEEEFEDDAEAPPPFPSCSNYDAKAWRFIKEHAEPGALFWNLGADLEIGTGADVIDPTWHVGDSNEVLMRDEIGQDFDFVFSCPPYGDLEVYSDNPNDISTFDMAEFDRVYAEIIAKAVARLADNRFACFVVGDYRDKRGIYANFVSKTIAAFEAAGAALYNEAILVTSVGSLPIRTAKQFRSTRKLGKTHQNVLVFVKGDPRKAVDAIGPVNSTDVFQKFEGE